MLRRVEDLMLRNSVLDGLRNKTCPDLPQDFD